MNTVIASVACKFRKLMLVLVLGMGVSMVHGANIREFTFESVVQWGPSGLGYPTTGTVLHGSFGYDLNAQLEPMYPDHYGSAVTSFYIDGLLEKKSGGGSVVAISNDIGNPLLDQFTLAVDVTGPQIDGITPLQFLMRLRDETGLHNAFSSNALPETLNFSAFTNNYFELSTSKGTLRATITNVSPVPEPQTYAMMLAGLALMGASVRRKSPPAP